MIFDLFDPLREPSLIQFALLLASIVFIADFYYLRKAGFAERMDARPLLDLQIALVFCVGYFALAAPTWADEEFVRNLYSCIGLASLAWAHLLICLYESEVKGEGLGQKAVPIAIALAGSVAVWVLRWDLVAIGVLAIAAFSYWQHVLGCGTPQQRKAKPQIHWGAATVTLCVLVLWVVIRCYWPTVNASKAGVG